MRASRIFATLLCPVTLLGLFAAACSEKSNPPAPTPPAATTEAPKPSEPAAAPAPATAEAPDSLPKGLLIGYAQFVPDAGGTKQVPGPALLEMWRREGGEWKMESLEDKDSNVFHKALAYGDAIVTLGGMDAVVKRWTRKGGALTAEVLWKESFGGKFNRMRDAEVGAIYPGESDLAVATHDQGVVGVIRPDGAKWKVEKLDHKKDTFIHEIELGDLDKDGTLEVYATPSEPNTLEGGAQHGEVVRYVPAKGEGRVVVADLGNRHAKEIYVGDVDGDGTDELYVAVEALTTGEGGAEIVEPVEIRRFDKGTDPKSGAVVAKLNDRFCRFLTVGDVDGDG
ncbi:MAG: hypothetical protein KC417_02355, partial [Myxococcales bacterium]|nr:hypothetical protein [Myxococcales bacterium]